MIKKISQHCPQNMFVCVMNYHFSLISHSTIISIKMYFTSLLYVYISCADWMLLKNLAAARLLKAVSGSTMAVTCNRFSDKTQYDRFLCRVFLYLEKNDVKKETYFLLTIFHSSFNFSFYCLGNNFYSSHELTFINCSSLRQLILWLIMF